MNAETLLALVVLSVPGVVWAVRLSPLLRRRGEGVRRG